MNDFDALEQQFINETLDLMKKMNDKYKDFFHYQVLTIVPMENDKCAECIENGAQCKRLVVGMHEIEEHKPKEGVIPLSKDNPIYIHDPSEYIK